MAKTEYFDYLCFDNSKYVFSTFITGCENKIFVVILTQHQKQPISREIQRCMIAMVH